MDQHRLKIKFLCALALTGVAYSLLLNFQETLTGKDTLDGIISVVFGLYMSSHPAAFIVDLLFFRHSGVRVFFSDRSLVLWLILNLLVLLLGWFVIFIGTTRLMGG
jgi:hypothetical protein